MNEGAPADSAALRGRRVWSIGVGLDLLSGVVAGLRELGADVSHDDHRAGPQTQAEADDLVARFANDAGEPDLVVLSLLPAETTALSVITDLDEVQWRAGPCDGLRATLYLLRALGPRLKPRGGAIVFVGPSLSLVGCPRLVALSALLEGQRGMMKSVARQWGATGVTLNWIAAAPRALSSFFDDAPLAAKPDMVSVALGAPPDPGAAIAPVLAFLAGPAGRAITGVTLTLDGGEWMVP